MEKVKEFLTSLKIAIKWTIWYCVALYALLQYLFGFNLFSQRHWWKFFHSNFHGFAGFAFQIILYAAVPLYIATFVSSFRNKEYPVKIPLLDKIITFVKSKFSKAEQAEPEAETATEEEEIQNQESIYPEDLPHELRVPFMRAKNNLSLKGAVSAYNKVQPESKTPDTPAQSEEPIIPIPTDFEFDISDLEEIKEEQNNTAPVFKDINFDIDTPILTKDSEEPKLENNTTKYLKSKNIIYETFKNFIATEKYLIYEHNDGDFWIFDEDSWFASGKQIESPIPELINLAKSGGVIPVLFLESQNIMDIENVSEKFESLGVRVIKSLEELD